MSQVFAGVMFFRFLLSILAHRCERTHMNRMNTWLGWIALGLSVVLGSVVVASALAPLARPQPDATDPSPATGQPAAPYDSPTPDSAASAATQVTKDAQPMATNLEPDRLKRANHPGSAPHPAELDAKLAATLTAAGPSYRPRTRHYDGSEHRSEARHPDPAAQAGAKPTYTNRLLLEPSPLLAAARA